MSEKVNNALIDLVVKAANDIGKHHADVTLQLVSDDMDDRFTSQKELGDLAFETITAVDARQKEAVNEIDRLSIKLTEVDTAVREFAAGLVEKSNDSFASVASDVMRLQDAVKELLQITGDNENINALADLVKEMSESFTSGADSTFEAMNAQSQVLSDVIDDISKISDDVAGNDEALSARIDKVFTLVDSVTAAVSKDLVEQEAKHTGAMDKLISDYVDIDTRLTKARESIIGHEEDLGSLSKYTHKHVDDLLAADSEREEALLVLRGLLHAAETENTNLLHKVDDVSAALSEQFSELKNESFLSSDKIDMKFAEMQLALVESDVKRDQVLREAVTKQCDRIANELDDSFSDYEAALDRRVADDKKTLIEGVSTILKNDRLQINRAKQWVPGVEYGEACVARNLGGIWQAICKTSEEPTANSTEWVCLSCSFHKVTKIEDHLNGVEMVIGVHDSLGTVHELSVPLSKTNYLKGVYQPDVEYKHLDSIMKDGCRWVATKDSPEGAPGDDDADWQVLTMRGPRGMKGAQGERGPKGLKGDPGEKGAQGGPGPAPDMDDIVKALVDFEKGDDGQAIRRARGNWKLGESYRAGDVTTVGRGLFLALRANDGMDTPGSSTEDWLLLVEASGGGGGGASEVAHATPTFGGSMF